jgi:hypothetical protein
MVWYYCLVWYGHMVVVISQQDGGYGMVYGMVAVISQQTQ